jgi:tetratricopeptide (TPR) repeat protein
VAVPDAKMDITKMPVDELQAYAVKYPGSYPVQLFLGNGLRKAGKTDEAMQAFERAAALAPMAAGPESPHAQMAAIAGEKSDRKRAITELKALLTADYDNVEAARKLAKLMKEEGITDPAALRPVYERITAVDPYDADAHEMLGSLAMKRSGSGDADIAIREYKAVIALGAVDKAASYTNLAEAYSKGGKRAEAKKQVLAALEIAPSYQRGLDLLLALSETH